MKKIEKGGIQGATFGVMEAAVMMIGVLLGLSVTNNKFVITLGLLTAGVADAISNSTSFFVSEESEMIHTRKEIWKASLLCFFTTIVTVLIIAIPLLAFESTGAGIIASFSAGMAVLILLGGYMAKQTKAKNRAAAVAKYVIIGIAAAAACYAMGLIVNMMAQSIA